MVESVLCSKKMSGDRAIDKTFFLQDTNALVKRQYGILEESPVIIFSI